MFFKRLQKPRAHVQLHINVHLKIRYGNWGNSNPNANANFDL